MKWIIFLLLTCISVNSRAQNTEKEKVVTAYYMGYEKKDWNTVASQLADGFTFTSPVNDHISFEEFKKQCWGTAKFFKKVNFIKMVENGNNIILLVEINTTDNKLVRNVDIFTFDSKKIKSVEVFFGLGEGYPGNTK